MLTLQGFNLPSLQGSPSSTHLTLETCPIIKMSKTRSLETITKVQLEKELAEQERLLEDERNNERPIIKTMAKTSGTSSATTTTTSDTTPATTTSTTTTSTRTTATTSGTHQQRTTTGGKLTDNMTNDLDDPNSYRKHGLCGSRRCLSHYACRDPLLYRRSVCDRLSNLLHTGHRYELMTLILKITAIFVVLLLGCLLCYRLGKIECVTSDLENQVERRQS